MAPTGFDNEVMRAIRATKKEASVNWWEQLGLLFPRLAVTAVALIILCGVIDYFDASLKGSSLNSDLTALSIQWQQTGAEE